MDVPNDNIPVEYTDQNNLENIEHGQEEQSGKKQCKIKQSTRPNLRKILCQPGTWQVNIRHNILTISIRKLVCSMCTSNKVKNI